MLESAWQLGSAASARGACFTPRQTTQASVALPSRVLRTAGARRIPALPLPWPRRLHGVRQRAVHMEGVAGRCYSTVFEHAKPSVIADIGAVTAADLFPCLCRPLSSLSRSGDHRQRQVG